MAELFDLDLLDDKEPFQVDDQAAHLFKHPALGIEDIIDVWRSDPLFYPAKPPAHWLMVSEVAVEFSLCRSRRPTQVTRPSAGHRLL